MTQWQTEKTARKTATQKTHRTQTRQSPKMQNTSYQKNTTIKAIQFLAGWLLYFTYLILFRTASNIETRCFTF